MKTIRLFTIITTILLGCYVLSSCGKSNLKKNIIQMIENEERQLLSYKSAEELSDSFTGLLEMITEYLDVNDNFRYTEGDEDYEEIMDHLMRYNAGYTSMLSIYNPEISWKDGERDKAIQLMTIMKMLENRTLTTRNMEKN